MLATGGSRSEAQERNVSVALRSALLGCLCCAPGSSRGCPHLTSAWIGRWTKVTDKQQGTLLLLQKEKGKLAMQLDSLREENDKLHAMNRNNFTNSMIAHKAEQDTEITALCKDRVSLIADLDALKAQSAFSQQQLIDKSEELRLAVQEASNLRAQLASLTEDLQRQKHRLAAADAKVLETDRDLSRAMASNISAVRKGDHARVMAAKTLHTQYFKRSIKVRLQQWSHLALRHRYLRMHMARMRRRATRRQFQRCTRDWNANVKAVFRDRSLVDLKRGMRSKQ
jgi:hypothetical protein